MSQETQTGEPTEEQTAQIAKLNDDTRAGLHRCSQTLFTAGMSAIIQSYAPELDQQFMEQAKVLKMVRDRVIDEGNNPHGERDFGVFEYSDRKCFWKIDYYNIDDQNYGSEAPWDASKTLRILTIMLASEY